MDTGKIIAALAPVFAAGFAVQQLLEILTSFLDLDSREVFQKYKKPILGAVAFGLGWALAAELGLGVLDILKGGDGTKAGTLDLIVTALVISAGTEGVNSIVKFLKYSKEDKKREAAAADPNSAAATPQAPAALDANIAAASIRVPTTAALRSINQQ